MIRAIIFDFDGTLSNGEEFDYDNLYEISEKDLDSLINKLNDIYALIKD